jgi:DNA-binding NarL/FixJ family response regulator
LAALSGAQHSRSHAVLTQRERQVVSLIERGLSNKEIARDLGIQVTTVKGHVHNILEKLDARRRSEIVARVRDGRGSRPGRHGAASA